MSETKSTAWMNRRGFLSSAVSLMALVAVTPAFAQSAMDDVINAPKRGNWDDQFDGDAATSRVQASVLSNSPMLGPDTVVNMEQAIAMYQAIVANGGWPTVQSSQTLQLGVIDPAVQVLRKRLMITGDLPQSAGMSDSFDTYVEAAVKRFQARHGLPEDGVMGEYTVKAMNIAADVRLAQLNTNLQRMKTMNADLGRRFVMVNIPAAYIEAVENNRVALRNTAIVGRISRPTPILNSKIYDVTLSPYWNAPRSIVEKDIVPLMRKDPTYLTKNAIRLIDGKGHEVDPKTIDWNAPKAPDLLFRQDPGKINAMSSTKINFHNQYSVYMHDTPQQGLFNKLMRFESSGCVRVQNVRDLITWLLNETPGWPRENIEKVIQSRVNTPIPLKEEVPVYFVYFTAWSAKDHVVQFRDDIYQLDGNAQLALQTTTGIEQPAAD